MADAPEFTDAELRDIAALYAPLGRMFSLASALLSERARSKALEEDKESLKRMHLDERSRKRRLRAWLSTIEDERDLLAERGAQQRSHADRLAGLLRRCRKECVILPTENPGDLGYEIPVALHEHEERRDG